jgi:hypothetical protein
LFHVSVPRGLVRRIEGGTLSEPTTPTPTPGTTAEESANAQDDLTASVGPQPTRESHDAKAPFWKRLLGKS